MLEAVASLRSERRAEHSSADLRSAPKAGASVAVAWLLLLRWAMTTPAYDVRMQEQAAVQLNASGVHDSGNVNPSAVQMVMALPVVQTMDGVPLVTELRPIMQAAGRGANSDAAQAAHETTSGGAGGPIRARKTKRMDRRLTHWQCTFCRHEMRNDAGLSVCSKCGGAKAQLRDADA